MLLLEPAPAYLTLRHKLAWIDTRAQSPAQITVFLTKKGIPILDVGKFIATALSKTNLSEGTQSQVSKILETKIETERRIPEGWTQPLICLSNLGILLEPDLQIQASFLLKALSKNTFLIILWDYICDEPDFFHWGTQKQAFNLDFSGTGIKKIPFSNDI